MKTAKFIRWVKNPLVDQALYRLSEPIRQKKVISAGYTDHGRFGTLIQKVEYYDLEYVIVSTITVNGPWGRNELLIFPSDSEGGGSGSALDAGGIGVLDHAVALRELGYEIEVDNGTRAKPDSKGNA